MEENKIKHEDTTINPLHLEGLIFGIAWLVTFAAMFVGFEPLLLTSMLIIFVVAALIYRALRWNRRPVLSTISLAGHLSSRPLTTILFAFSAYVALSTLWSANMLTSISKALLVATVILACRLGHYLTTTASNLQMHRFSRGILIGIIIGFMFPLIEFATNHAILNFLVDKFPELIQTDGTNQQVPAFYLNRSVSALILCLWPALLVAYVWSGRAMRAFFIILLTGIMLPVLFLTHSETAKVALLVGAFGFIGTAIYPRTIASVASGLWITAVLGTIPLIMVLHWSGLQNATWLPYSARDRIHIWHYTAQRVVENPVLGIGIRSSRTYKKPANPVKLAKGTPPLADHPGWHSHNIFLQTWYELGAVGALFLLATGLLLLRELRKLEHTVRPFAYAGFASFAAISAFGYGLWQSWLLACFGWMFIFFLMAIRYAETNKSPRIENEKQVSPR